MIDNKQNNRCEPNKFSVPGGALNPRFEKFGGPLCEFVDPGAEYLLFSDVVSEVNVRLATKINLFEIFYRIKIKQIKHCLYHYC